MKKTHTRKTTAVFLIFAILSLSGCLSTTYYTEEGFGGGFTDMPLGNDRYSITVRGNGVTDMKRVQDIALVRAAVISKEAGDGYFLIIDNEKDTKSKGGYTSGNVGYYGNYSSTTSSVNNHYHTLVIELVDEEVQAQVKALSADEIIRNLGPSVRYKAD